MWLNIYGTHSYSCSQSFFDSVERGAVEFLAVTLLLRLGGFGGGISLTVASFSTIFTEPNRYNIMVTFLSNIYLWPGT